MTDAHNPKFNRSSPYLVRKSIAVPFLSGTGLKDCAYHQNIDAASTNQLLTSFINIWPDASTTFLLYPMFQEMMQVGEARGEVEWGPKQSDMSDLYQCINPHL